MKITSVHITLRADRPDGLTVVNYQNSAYYLTLGITDWIRGKKLDLGAFNRVVFEEDSPTDFTVVGDRALAVRLADDFPGAEEMNMAPLVHAYFTRKYREGFQRFDEHYNPRTKGFERKEPLD